MAVEKNEKKTMEKLKKNGFFPSLQNTTGVSFYCDNNQIIVFSFIMFNKTPAKIFFTLRAAKSSFLNKPN